MVNPIQAIMQRLREHIDAERGQSTNALGVGGLYNTPIVGIPARVAGGVLNAAGLAQEPFNKVANTGAGEIGLLASLVQAKLGDPNSTATQAARLALAQGPAHPGRAIEALRTGPDTGTAWLGGVLEMVSNPLNYVGGIGEAGTALRAGGEAASAAGNVSTAAALARGAGRTLQGVGLTGEIVNRAGMLPLYLSPKGLGRLTERPAFLRTVGNEVSSPLKGALERLGGIEAPPPLPRSPFELAPPMPNERGNVPIANLIPGVGENGRRGLGPLPTQDVRDELAATLANEREQAAVKALAQRSQREFNQATVKEGAAIDRLAAQSEQQYQRAQAKLPLPKPQPIGDLIGAAERTAQPSPLEGLIGAGNRLGLGTKPPTPPTPRLPIPLPEGAVTRAEERVARAVPDLIDNAAPTTALDFPQLGGTREEALAQLSSDELSTLVDIAYPVDAARGNAITAHQDPVELANAALDRITRDGHLAAQLSATDDALARKLAYLPEPGAVAVLPGGGGLRNGETMLIDKAGNVVNLGERAPLPGTPVGGDTYPAFLNLIRSVTGDLPLPNSPFYASKLGVAAEDVPGLFQRAAGEGIIGELPMEPGRFAVKPGVDTLAMGGDIAAGGGGGGGLGLVPFVGGLHGPVSNAMLEAGSGGTLGAVGGGIYGATQDADSTSERMQNIIKGAGTGAGIGVAVGAGLGLSGLDTAVKEALPKYVTGSMLDPGMHADGIAAGLAAQAAAGEHTGVKGVGNIAKAAEGQWRAQVVMTLKQLPQDALTRAFIMWGAAAKEFGATGADLRRWQAGLRQERAAGVSMLDNPVTSWLRDLGKQDKLARLGDTYGVDFVRSQMKGQDEFTGAGRAATGALIGLGSAAKTVNPVAPVYGAVRGYFAPFVNAYIGFMNGIQHDAFRFALAEKALNRDVPRLADDFLFELASKGHNVKALEGLGGRFSPEDVARVAGPQAAKDWGELTDMLIEGQGNRIAFLGGDFRDKLAKDYTGTAPTGAAKAAARFEQGFGKFVPFARFQIHYAPVLAEIAIRHPRAALIAGRELQREGAEAKDQGKKAYQSGITITDKTPLVGLAARARNGGGEGSLTLDPVGALMPYGDALTGGDELPADATGYQRAVNIAGRVGFSPNPLVQSLAYITGQDYRTPSSLSRTAGLESGVEAIPAAARLAGVDVPDLPQLPSGRNLLDAGRELLKPVTGEGAVAPSDPVLRRYAELVIAQTGKPLDDKSNRDYLMGVNNPDNPLWNLATVQARTAGAATNATGLISPIQTTAQSREATQAQQAGPLPVSDYQISQAPKSQQPGLRAALDRVIALNPATATYRNINPNARRATLLAEFDLKNARLKQMAPQLYAERRKLYEASLP